MEKNIYKRNEVPEELTWNLKDIYPDEAAWEKEIGEALKLADEIAALDGHLAEKSENLLNAFRLYEKCVLLIDRFASYAMRMFDQDTGDSHSQGMRQRALTTDMQISEKLSFLEPEVLSISEQTMAQYFKEQPGLDHFSNTINEIRRQKAHTLSKEMEQLLASAGEITANPQQAFSMLNNADLKFPTVKDPEGKEVQITNGRFVPLMESKDRNFRKAVFEAYYESYKSYKNTWAALYSGEVKARIFNAKARKYPSAFEAAVDHNNVSPAVCDNLIKSVHKNMDKMHHYVRLRKKLLNLDELHMYDIYPSIVSNFEMKVTYEEAKEISLKALAPLGEEYLSIVKRAYKERWIDVVENEGKRSGAYSAGVYGVHPYMLLNYNDNLDNVFTLVHEMGHSMHTWYSDHAQSMLDSQYKIFVAEVASTTNEVLLFHYLMKNASSKEEKAYLLNHMMDSFKGTLFRQTMFEEFERKTCSMAEEGIPLTADTMAELYLKLNEEYYGPEMVSDPLIAWEWCRIPHFYYNFYVYQYATSFSAAVAIAKRILDEGEPYVKQYLQFLSSGCTKDPVSLLKIAGIDLSTSKPIDDAMVVFEETIREMEELYGI